MKPLVSIFTPTYNRESYLYKLYESLKNQSVKNFQWIIVDDGSIDMTEEVIKNFKDEGLLEIIYKKVENGGKMRAINHGVDLAQGEYFFIVDSDDYITSDAVEKIEKYSKDLPGQYGGMVFRKYNISGKNFPEFPERIIDSTPIDIFYKMGVLGDKAEIFRTSVMREFRFPEIKGEKFIPEGLVWNRIGRRYKMRYINEIIYNFEYIEGGYTNSFKTILKRNPKGFMLYYSEMLSYEIPLKNKIKFAIRYFQTFIYSFFKE